MNQGYKVINGILRNTKSKDPYVYSTGTLINKLGIRGYQELRQAEADICFGRLITVDRDVEFTDFDLEYLKRIHKYILGDIFDWAGELRSVQMVKAEDVLGGDTVRYSYPSEIKREASKILKEMNEINWSEISDIDKKVEMFSKKIAQLWQVHPFRDGNTRTITTFAFKFAKEHDFEMYKPLMLEHLDYVRKSFVKASDGQYSDYTYLNKIVKDSIETREK